MSCYCGNGANYENCCQPLHKKQKVAQSPVELMRSRYSAFCTKDIPYLIETTDPQARGHIDEESYREWAEMADFKKLEVLKYDDLGNKGHVEFKAWYDIKGKELLHHEYSKFRKQSGVWYYREGKDLSPEMPELEE